MKDVEGVKKLQTRQLNFLYLLLLIAYIPMLFLGLTDYDEGAFAATSLQMLRDGQYFVPLLGEELRLEKPILSYWIQSLFLAIFGNNEFALRLPSVISAVAWGYVFADFIQKCDPNIRNKNQVLTLFLLPGFFLISSVATADAFLNLFITLSLISLYKFTINQEQKYLNSTAIFIGIGFLIKGFAIIAIAGPVFLIYCLLSNKKILFLKAAISSAAWIRFLLIVCPWFVVLYLRTDIGSIQYLLLGQSFGRFSEAMENHSGNYYYYFVVLPFLIFPFLGNFLLPLKKLLNLRKSHEKFLFIWFLWVFIFFTFSSTKLPHYLIYGLTPLAYFIEKSFQISSQAVYKFGSLLFDVICILLLFIFPYIIIYVADLNPTYELSVQYFENFIEEMTPPILLFVLFAILIFQFINKIRYVFVKKFFAASLLCYLSFFLLPLIIDSSQKDLKVLSKYLKQNDLPLVVYKINKPTSSFYSGKPYIRDKVEGEVLLTRKDKLVHLNQKYKVMKESGNYLIVFIENEDS